METSTAQANRQIARAAGTVMAALVVGQLVGLARSILVARAFGAGADLDAFYASNRVPDTIFNLLAGGALSSAFIPTFTTALAKKDREGAWRLASSVANLLILILGVLAILAAIFARQIVHYALAAGFSVRDPAQEALTVHLMRIQLVAAVLFGLGGLVMGILNSYQVFLIPALTPSMYQIGLIFGVLVLVPKIGVAGLAYGVVIGSGFYLLLQIPALIKQKGSYTPSLGYKNPDVGEVIRLMGPRLIGVAVVYVNLWVNTYLASFMANGSVTGINLGFALMLMAQVAIAQSIATAAMPTFASQYALGRQHEIRASLSATLRSVLLLSIPASIGLIVLRVPIIAMIYQHGKFDESSTNLVAWALLWYAAGLVGHSILEILARTFYAMHDTKTPVIVGASAMGLNVVFSFTFSSWFTHLGWMPHGGLALANSLATAIEASTLFFLMRKRMKGLQGRELAKTGLSAMIGGLSMTGILLIWMAMLKSQPAVILASGGVLSGGLVYGFSLLLLKVPELRNGIALIQQRLPWKKSS